MDRRLLFLLATALSFSGCYGALGPVAEEAVVDDVFGGGSDGGSEGSGSGDSDGDGIPDSVEGQDDPDGDGQPA